MLAVGLNGVSTKEKGEERLYGVEFYT